MSNSLRSHGLQHTRPPCPSPTLGAYSNSCSSSRWCHPNMSSSIIPFSSCPQSFPASGPFPMSQFFTSGGRSIGVSASTSVLPRNTQDWPPLGWTESLLNLLEVQETLKSLLQHHSSKASILWHSAFFIVQLSLLNKVKVHKLKKNQIAFNQNKQTTAPYLPFLPQSSRPWQALIHFASVDLPILDFSYIWNHKI